MELSIVIFRTIFFYFFIILMYRLMGKREIGQLSILDLIVSILIAELVAISIENTSKSMMLTLLPIIVIVVIEMLLSYISLKSSKFRSIVDGKPSVIICEGKLNYHELVKQRYNIDDLLLNLRLEKIKSIEDVEYAFLEPNGKLSIFIYEKDRENKKVFPYPIILDGNIEENYLEKVRISKSKIKYILSKNKLELSNIFYAFYQNGKIFIIEKTKSSKVSFLNNKYIK